MIAEEDGLADCLGISDGKAIELGIASGLDIKYAIDNRDLTNSNVSDVSISK